MKEPEKVYFRQMLKIVKNKFWFWNFSQKKNKKNGKTKKNYVADNVGLTISRCEITRDYR